MSEGIQGAVYKTHETRNGALCGDLFALTGNRVYIRDTEGRTDRVYRKCAFGFCSNPRYEWVNDRNIREHKSTTKAGGQ